MPLPLPTGPPIGILFSRDVAGCATTGGMWRPGLPPNLQMVFDRHADLFPACAACVFTPETVRFATAGAAAVVSATSREGAVVPVDEHTYFDLASLTKALATAPAVFALAAEGRLDLDDPPRHILPLAREPLRSHLAAVRLVQLLNHSAGLPAYAPFFETCTSPDQLLAALGALVPAGPAGENSLYSDIGYIILGHHLSSILGEHWTDWAQGTLYEPQGLRFSFWGVPHGAVLACNQEPGGTFGGQVHDENARILGPACGQAGLFGSLAQVTGWLQILREIGSGRSSGPLQPESVRRMWTPLRPDDAFTLGFDRPSRTGFTTAGDNVERDTTVGHLGFSGTAFWLHPPTGRGGVLLTNRVALGRHTFMQELRTFRAEFFTALWRSPDPTP
ncbi:beta-lactamase family protein [Myxococcota bacterium]|nr:beta-lactamase family protein [Myxococcota bacterium]